MRRPFHLLAEIRLLGRLLGHGDHRRLRPAALVSGVLLQAPSRLGLQIATVIHGEEALLAVIFIFTVHFFNVNLRPEKFPMDLLTFTGRLPEHELIDERPLEYERLVRQRGLKALEAPTPTAQAVMFSRLLGGVGLVLGVITILIITYSALV